jgi:Cys-tRNA(Pro)/Cys-tRNA(Cys) deacylase
MAEEKTNVMRILDQKRVPYTPHHYAHPNGAVDGASVAALLDRDPASVCNYKGMDIPYMRGILGQYVFIIPVLRSLDLKAAARAVGEKSIEMIPQARLLPLTGYVHGGCSPVGMKKPFPTVLDGSVEGLDAIVVSAGKIGAQVELAPAALCALVGGTFAPVSK